MKIISLSALILLVASCGLNDNHTKNDSPTSGSLKVFADEGLQLHIANQAYTFTMIYKFAAISVSYLSEPACIEGLFKDSCKVIVLNRDLSSDERKKFEAKNIMPQSIKVATTAIAFISATIASDSLLKIEQISSLLEGRDSSMYLVFDQQNSGVNHYLFDSLLKGKKPGKNCFALNNTPELVNYVYTHPNTIGVMNYAWLSDKDDTLTKQFLKKIKILPVAKEKDSLAYFPDQSNIATRDYPFCMDIYLIKRSSEFSLGKGFQTFVAGEKGQLMFLKQGLPANNPPPRVVNINISPLKSEE